MKILSIGNSFSSDATRYLYGAAKSAGIEFKTLNLYIGGCPLYRHYVNTMEDMKAYEAEFNGVNTKLRASVREALISDEFDVVTLQQASGFSFREESYEPYIEYMVNYIGKYLPKAKIYIHQTWGYKPDSAALARYKFTSHREMYEAAEKCYVKMYEKYGFNGFLPSGRAILNLVEAGLSPDSIFRDDIHASLGVGRYTQALTWLEYLTGVPASGNTFREFDVPVSDEAISVAQRAASDACAWANANGYSKK